MKKIYLALTCLAALVATTACDDFLDVRPSGEKVEDDIFETSKGFESAIYGVYGSLNDSYLYGCDLLWGTTELLAQNLDCDSQYGIDMATYDYKSNADTRKRLLGIWSSAYLSIGYANNVLQQLEKKDPSSMEMYNLYKGEMLGVRALLHFDLLRLFAPTDESKRGIPYVTTYSFSVKPFSTVKQCYDYIIADLTEAEKLLTADKSMLVYPRDDNKYEAFNNYRETHMNLYAVKALLARVYWYRGDMTNAAKYATEVIDSKVFPLVDVTEVKDYLAGVISPKETIFGIYSNKYLETSQKYLYSYQSYVSYNPYDDITGKKHLEPWHALYALDIDGSAQDFRTQHFQQTGGICKHLKLVDYRTIENTGRDNKLIAGVTVLHSSEMYLIAAEALLASNYNRALGYFNDEITSRGLPALTPDQTLTAERIYNEYRKELFGEGQLWFNMKRLNRDIVSNYASTTIMANDDIYVLPIPDEEFEYRPTE